MSAYAVQEQQKIGAKDGVVVCMGVEYYENDSLNRKYDVGTNMMRIKCPNCVLKGSRNLRQWEIPLKNGFTNPWNHYKSCVGDDATVRRIYFTTKQKMEAAKREEALDDNDDNDASKPKVQGTLANFGFVPSAEVMSEFHWIRLIVLKNMPISDVDCEEEKEGSD